MKSRQQSKVKLVDLMKAVIKAELQALGVFETRTGKKLHNASYQELKWTYALELAKREE